MEQQNTPSEKPTAQDMLDRLQAIDIDQLNIKKVTEELKANKAWWFVFAMPAAALLLVIFTLLGLFLFDSLLISFVVAAIFVFMLGKILDSFEGKYRLAARDTVIQRIAEHEGEFGLLPHFKHFLPNKYRYLRQQLKQKHYMYVNQYIAAVYLLQNKLDNEKFTEIWHIKHPETKPEDAEENENTE